MLLTLKTKLQPTTKQRRKLFSTLKIFNEACDTISREAYESNTFNKYKLHHRTYHRVRDQHKLPAQLTIRAIGKVVELQYREAPPIRLRGAWGNRLRSENNELQRIRQA